MPTYSDAQLMKLTQDMADCLVSQQHRLITTESCTGGWLAKCCTDLDGSSKWFAHGIVSYSNHAKQHFLHVSPKTLLQFGAVSEQTAAEMARGALRQQDASLAVAITGIAGPSGGTSTKPVGTVCFAVASHHHVDSQRYHFDGNRDAIRRQAVATAIQLIIKNARAHPQSMG